MSDLEQSTDNLSKSSRRLYLLLGLIIAALVCWCIIAGTIVVTFLLSPDASTPIPSSTIVAIETVQPATSTATNTPEPSNTPTPGNSGVNQVPPTVVVPTPESVVLSTEEQLRSVQVPANDSREIARRLRPELGDVPLIVSDTTPDYNIGDIQSFWVRNTDTLENFEIEAKLRAKTPHLYMWSETGLGLEADILREAADFFEEQIYKTNRAFFGSEWSPGVDNDPRLHILHATGMAEGVAGYFSASDEASSLIDPYSNEKEMFYINLDTTAPGTTFYYGVLAHEFQHMIHWAHDPNESIWLNEGAAELAAQLNGVGRTEADYRPDQVFSTDPDVQLNTWPESNDSYVHYGNSYLFMNYFLGRFGEEITQALIADPANSMESIDQVLKKNDLGLTASELFADWVLANWLDAPELSEGRWGYPNFNPDPMAASAYHESIPASAEGTVHQYAADYILVDAEGDMTISFRGDSENRLAATDAYSGEWAWWSNRVDNSDSHLTFSVDLSDVEQATLQYQTWYAIEENWDYAYVEASDDGGNTWVLLETERTTNKNPQGSSYGHGYTGLSGGETPEWVQEEVDLSAYAGQAIDIRFEYITDPAVTAPGMFIDDIAIPEIGYFNDLENGPGDWQSQGWLLTNNTLSQNWIVQVIETDASGRVRIHQLPVDESGMGQLRFSDLAENTQLVLAISAIAPVTVETANYSYDLTPE